MNATDLPSLKQKIRQPGITLYRHQSQAYQRFKDVQCGALFFATGTGKSGAALVIAQYKYEHSLIDTLLIIAPNGVHRMWAQEHLAQWLTCPYNVQCSPIKKCLQFHEGALNIVCINVEQFSTQTAYKQYIMFALAHKTMIVLDEATRIKNPKAKRTQRILQGFNDVKKRGRALLSSTPRTVARLALTGTPTTNSPTDVWAIYEFLQPGFWGMNYYAFQDTYCMMTTRQINDRLINVPLNEESWRAIRGMSCMTAASVFGISQSTYEVIKTQDAWQGPYKNLDMLRKRILEMGMIVKIEDVLDMPPQTYIVRHVAMEDEQARVYREMCAKLLATYKDQIVDAKTKVASYVRLQQIAAGFIPGTWIANSKIEALKADLNVEQAIIVTHFNMEAQTLYDTLTKDGYSVCLITGWKRVGTLLEFKEGKYQLMVANVKCISMGFNLQFCHYMYFFSNTFSLEDRLQVEARIYRSGQTHTCIYYDYIMNGTIEGKIYDMLKTKTALLDYIRQTPMEEFLNAQ